MRYWTDTGHTSCHETRPQTITAQFFNLHILFKRPLLKTVCEIDIFLQLFPAPAAVASPKTSVTSVFVVVLRSPATSPSILFYPDTALAPVFSFTPIQHYPQYSLLPRNSTIPSTLFPQYPDTTLSPVFSFTPIQHYPQYSLLPRYNTIPSILFYPDTTLSPVFSFTPIQHYPQYSLLPRYNTIPSILFYPDTTLSPVFSFTPIQH